MEEGRKVGYLLLFYCNLYSGVMARPTNTRTCRTQIHYWIIMLLCPRDSTPDGQRTRLPSGDTAEAVINEELVAKVDSVSSSLLSSLSPSTSTSAYAPSSSSKLDHHSKGLHSDASFLVLQITENASLRMKLEDIETTFEATVQVIHHVLS